MPKKIDVIDRTEEHLAGQAGISLIGEMLDHSRIDSFCPADKPGVDYKNWEIIRAAAGLIAQGKADYEHVEDVREDDFFSHALKIGKAPSSPTYRQRLEGMAHGNSALVSQIQECSQNIWKTNKMVPEYITSEESETKWTRLDFDVTPWDNSGSHKEEVGRTYDGGEGYAPIFAHLGGGFIVNAQLRPGVAHSLHAGTHDYIFESSDLARRMIQEDVKLLDVLDCGFDDQTLISGFYQENRPFFMDFIIKHNLRRESKEDWLELAKKEGECLSSNSIRSRYRGSTCRSIEGVEYPVRMVYEVTEIKCKKGQFLLVPDIKVFSVWTSLTLSDAEVLRLYRERGTSEQYHSELKTEMDLERLPSGDFRTNELFFQIGILVYNMFRVISCEVIKSDNNIPLKKATRRRVKTIIQNVIYLCAKFVRTGRKVKVKLSCPHHWYEFFKNLFHRLRSRYCVS